jgi:hypothetical protein
MPNISVLMSVRNGAPYLRESIESLLNQTYEDFEFLIIDDASSDNSLQIIDSYADKRIKRIANGQQQGLTRNLNIGIQTATGRLVARMDHDDVSHPRRFEKQIAFLDDNPQVDLLGTWARTNGLQKEAQWRYPVRHEDICSEFVFASVLVHSSVMWRRERFEGKGLRYDEFFASAQDYELWTRAASAGVVFANLSDVLLTYRIHSEQVGNTNGGEQKQAADAVRVRELARLGIEPSAEEANLHNQSARWIFPDSIKGLQAFEDWLLRLKKANEVAQVYSVSSLAKTLEARWWAACRANLVLGLQAWRTYARSELSVARSVKEKAIFWSKAIVRELG